MTQFPSPPLRKIWIAALATLASFSASSRAQNFTMMVTNPNPLGLGAFVPSMTAPAFGLEGTIKGDFSYGFGIQSIYDSNFFQSESDEECELSMFFNPWIHYTSDPEGGATFSLVANYMPSFRGYLENSELNGNDQSFDIALSYRGSRTEFDVFGSYVEVSGTDLLTNEFVVGSILTTGFRANRQIAPRTSVDASWSVAVSDYSTGDSVGAEVYTTSLGAYWQATTRLSFGPLLRYTVTKSDNIATRDAWALMLSARYRVGERIILSASVGPEYYTYSGGSGDDDSNVSITGNLSASYMINERWTWTNSIDSGAAPSSEQQDLVINNVSLSTALQRKLLRGSLSGGLDCNFYSNEEVDDGTTTEGGDGQNVSAFLRYDRNLFSERVGFNSEIRYTLDNGEPEWTQLQISAGINISF